MSRSGAIYHLLFPGLTALIALGILDNLEKQGKIKSLLEMEHNSAEYLHALVETLRYVMTINKLANVLDNLAQTGIRGYTILYL